MAKMPSIRIWSIFLSTKLIHRTTSDGNVTSLNDKFDNKKDGLNYYFESTSLIEDTKYYYALIEGASDEKNQ